MTKDAVITRRLAEYALPRNFEMVGDALLVKGVRVLDTVETADSLQKTNFYIPQEVLKTCATKWVDTGVWVDHTDPKTRVSSKDRIANIHTPRFENDAIIVDFLFHGLNDSSKEVIRDLREGKYNDVSSEIEVYEHWIDSKKAFEVTDIKFLGVALVDMGACESCKLRLNRNQDIDITCQKKPINNANTNNYTMSLREHERRTTGTLRNRSASFNEPVTSRDVFEEFLKRRRNNKRYRSLEIGGDPSGLEAVVEQIDQELMMVEEEVVNIDDRVSELETVVEELIGESLGSSTDDSSSLNMSADTCPHCKAKVKELAKPEVSEEKKDPPEPITKNLGADVQEADLILPRSRVELVNGSARRMR